MTDHENVRTVLEAAASNPKVASVVAAATGSMGIASILSQVQTVLGLISLAIGCLTGLYVLRNLAMKQKIYERMWENGESLKE